jgi:hypothetical protein
VRVGGIGKVDPVLCHFVVPALVRPYSECGPDDAALS